MGKFSNILKNPDTGSDGFKPKSASKPGDGVSNDKNEPKKKKPFSNILKDKMNEDRISDLIMSAINNKPTETAEIFNELISAKLHDRVEDFKQNLAANMFNEPEVEETEEAPEENNQEEA